MTPKTADAAMISRAKELISACPAMTLATGATGGPWAAPVYYAGVKGCFYFFSSPEARHVQDAFADGRAAAAIYAEGKSWQDLQGLQMSGKISIVSHAGQASRAFLAYAKKFPFVKTFFGGAGIPDAAGFMSRFHACLYCFQPDCIVFMDNGIGFGFRREIPKESLA